MSTSTDLSETLRNFRYGDTTYGQQAETGDLRPIKKLPRSTFLIDPDRSSCSAPTSTQSLPSSFEPPIPKIWKPTSADSTPLQIWEGTVLEVDHAAGVMHVLLDAKMGQVPRHTADIDLEWVVDQDKALVRLGSVFYLTLFKRTRRGSIENSQELRFRRRPSWSTIQLNRINESASKLIAKMQALPLAE